MAFVLIVDDNVETCEAMSRLLHAKGHTIICAGNGREALTALDAMPDLVLLDMEMPKMDGIGFLESARELIGAGMPPVLLISGVEDGSCVARAIELGVKRVFHKGGFDPDELIACIAGCV